MTTAADNMVHNHPPGPKSSYLFGSLRELQRNPLPFYLRLQKEYGDIVRFRAVGPYYAYVFFHPDEIDYILRRNHQNYRKGIAHDRFRSMLGEGLLTSGGNLWLRQRRLMQPAFHRQRLVSFTTTMTNATAAMLERWQSRAEHGEAFDVSVEMTRLTLHIVGQTLFTTDISGDEAAVVRTALSTALDHINYGLSHIALPESFPTPRNLRYRKALRLLDEVVYDIIRERRPGGEDTGDLLSMLLLARDEETGEGMSDQQVHDEVLTLILAGHETTANALTWTWYLLSQYPQVEDKLHAELATVLGGRMPTAGDLPRLTYTKMVLEEALRLYPPAWGISRRALAADELKGYSIPAGAEVAVVQYVTHRHPDFWERPEVFDPERFTPARAKGRPNFAYFPFGGGPRLCIGNTFALTEAQVILAMVAQTYTLRLVPDQNIVPEPVVTLRPRSPLQMIAQTR
jgi:cytochrome P450